MSQLLSDRMHEVMLELSDANHRSLAQQYLIESLQASSSSSARDAQLRHYLGNILQADFQATQRHQDSSSSSGQVVAQAADLVKVDPSREVLKQYSRLETEAADSIADILFHRLLAECLHSVL
jgi:hypothetical protein